MNEPENQPEAASDSAIEELQNEVQSLRTLLSVSLVVLIVFSFCMDVFLFKQVSGLNAQRSLAQQNAAMITSQALEVWAKLSDYGKTHPDFTPVLDKYRPYVNQMASQTNRPAAQK